MLGFSPYLSLVFIILSLVVFGIFWYVFTLKGKYLPKHVSVGNSKQNDEIMEDASLLGQDELLVRVKTAFEKEDMLSAEDYLFHLVKRATDEQLVRESLEKLIEVTIQNEKFLVALEHGTRYRMSYGEVVNVELLLSKAHIELNDLESAMAIFEKILESEQDNVEALGGMAVIFRKRGDHERAREIQQELFALQQAGRE